MISINNLGLSGLKTILNIQSTTDSQIGSSPQVEDIIQAKSDSVLLSAAAKSITNKAAVSDLFKSQSSSSPQLADIIQAKSDSVLVSAASKNIGTTYQRLKATGNETAVSGFSKIVQSFGRDISGAAIADIATATGTMGSEDLQRYGSIAESVSSLGNSAIFAKFASQAATAFNSSQELGRGYLNATAAIVDAEYSGNRQEVINQKLTNLSDFMAKFSELGNPAEASKAGITSFTEFANSIGTMTKGTEIGTAIGNYTAPTEDTSSA
jgi:hypothetical protein